MRENHLKEGIKKPQIGDFLSAFDQEMFNVEQAYQAQYQTRNDQMKTFEKNFGCLVIQTKPGSGYDTTRRDTEVSS